jgi:A/G-specific adenine glycosylase
MLHQTQVPRVAAHFDAFLHEFPDPPAMAAARPGAVITAWANLGYPRRARRLWDAAVEISERGWPADLALLPGIGRYTANAVAAQATDADVPAVEVNIRRVVERVRGARLGERAAEREMVVVGRPLRGRDRLLALMDLGALVCRPRNPDCRACPLRRRCATRGELADARRSRQTPFPGSFRERRGRVLQRLRVGPAPVGELDAPALASLEADGLAVIEGIDARLP